MNISIDAIATFNPAGDIRPMFVRLEDASHELHTYKILSVVQQKNENLSGISSNLFRCLIEVGGIQREILIRYHFNSHKWALVG
ncbi:MAG: hypothetical protein ACK5ML_10070 [Lachnospiraceae bacterium]